jgi:multidrug resistance efflux pump
MLDDASLQKILGGAGAATLTGLILRSALRMVSRNRVDNARDRAEVDVITVLRDENKSLRTMNAELSKERNDAVSKVGALEERVSNLTRAVDELRAQIAQMERSLSRGGTY